MAPLSPSKTYHGYTSTVDVAGNPLPNVGAPATTCRSPPCMKRPTPAFSTEVPLVPATVGAASTTNSADAPG